MTKQDFFKAHAQQFAFELNASQLIEKALDDKFLIRVGIDDYEYLSDFLVGTG